MKSFLCLFALIVFSGNALAASAVKVTFTLNTTDANRNPLTQTRVYYKYRPDGFPTNTPLPMVLIFEAMPDPGSADTVLNAKANAMGFVVVTCEFTGNSSGASWKNDNPRIVGWEDYDYTTKVIAQVKASDNCNDVFITGLSKGGHMTWAFACEKPDLIKAAGPIDEFINLINNIPQKPVPIIVLQGTSDINVPCTMVKDSVDEWLAVNGLLNVVSFTSYEKAVLQPGEVTQATWRGTNGMQVAFVTITGGTHTYATPGIQTGYSMADGLWAFFSQYLTSMQPAPKIVCPPVNNVQTAGQPASFWVSATGNAPLAYQWQKNGTNIAGATANCYTTPPATMAENGATFRAVVTNASGTVTSAVATLTVNVAPAGPTITTAPADQVLAAGQPGTFSVAATGSGTLAYQWQKNGLDIVGATDALFAISSAITPDNGASFRVKVTDGNGTTTSTRATLTVKPADWAPVIVANVSRARILNGQTATFSIAAKRGATSYQWQRGIFTNNMADIPGATSSTYTTPVATIADHLTMFRCTARNSAGSATSASEMLFVTTAVKAPTDITSPLTVTAQVNAPFTYAIVSTGGTTPITFSASPLPAGLSVNAQTGVISGIPTVMGMTNVAMSASNSAGGFSRTLLLTVTNVMPPVTFSDWRTINFGAAACNPLISDELADPDGDGFRNFFEYATGTDPWTANPSPWTVALEGDFLTTTVVKNPIATGMLWSAESSGNLSIWNASDTTVLEDSINQFKVRDNFPSATASHRFLHLKLSK